MQFHNVSKCCFLWEMERKRRERLPERGKQQGKLVTKRARTGGGRRNASWGKKNGNGAQGVPLPEGIRTEGSAYSIFISKVKHVCWSYKGKSRKIR